MSDLKEAIQLVDQLFVLYQQSLQEQLDEWQDTQFNIKSESARDMLVTAVRDRVTDHVQQVIHNLPTID